LYDFLPCPNCGQIAEPPGCSSLLLLHLVLTLLTSGLWIPVWALITYIEHYSPEGKLFHCSACGTTFGEKDSEAAYE